MNTDALWRKIANDIRDAIVAGTYPVGAPVPTYRQMAADCDVSLTTVKRAYRHLQRAGVLQGTRGRDVRVRAVPPADGPLDDATEADLRAEIATLRDEIRRVAGAVADHVAAHTP